MSGTGNPGGPHQRNTVNNGDMYATNTGNININHGAPPAKRGPRTDTKVLLVILLVNVGYFVYGAASYTGGTDRNGDLWRSCSFIMLLLVTIAMIGRWVRRRI